LAQRFQRDTRARFATPVIAGRVIRLSTRARYGVAIAAAIIAILARLALDPVWGVKLPYITLFPAIMVAAWLGGAWPGILTTLVTGTAAVYFWIEPSYSWQVKEPSEFLGLAVFVLVGVVISTLNQAWRSTAAALSESEEHLRVTLASIGDAVIATDGEGCIQHMNAIAEHLTGWTEAEAIQKRLTEVLVIVNEQTRQPIESPVGRVLREDVVIGLANHAVLIAKDGREIPIDDSAAPIRTSTGEVLGVVMIFRDVIERRRVDVERAALLESERAARAAAEAAVQVRDEFLSIASHELRNPVNAVQLQLAGVLREVEHGGDALKREWLGERIGRAQGQVNRLTRLIDNLLDVSRITAGAMVLEPEDIDLRAIIRAAVEHFRDDLKPSQAVLSLPVEPVRGRWDPVRLDQVVSNLLSNAIKYGNGKPIELSLQAESDALRLSITDHGIGIEPDQRQRLFQQFERAVSGRQYGGFGLGLWITRRIVEAMQGTIAVVDSRPGEGSTFVVTLPRH
jgi:PAS domain S-box-containing protein